MRVLSLFSGGGLGDYGLELAGMEIVGQVEIDDYCQKILKLRWPDVSKWMDIKNVRGSEVIEKCGRIDLVSGGFPCQDISNANRGKNGRLGLKGERSGLWREMFRLICEIRPRYVLVENVPAITQRGLDVVLSDLASQGYDAEWDCLSAADFGAPHLRERFFLVAYTDGRRFHDGRNIFFNDEIYSHPFWRSTQNIKSGLQWERWAIKASEGLDGEISESDFFGMDDGVAEDMERIKLLGNGQVVQVVEWIGRRILEFDAKCEETQGLRSE